MPELWTAVSGLLALISKAYRNFSLWHHECTLGRSRFLHGNRMVVYSTQLVSCNRTRRNFISCNMLCEKKLCCVYVGL